MLGKAANEYFDLLAEKWLAGNAKAFDARAIAHYRASFTDPPRIHASCEDYRAGQTTDVTFDKADRDAGRKITVPMLALWGANGLPRDLDPLAVWRNWATDVRGTAIDCGHFLCEEAPAATAQALIDFFTA
jgi:haloacetate dehalogenase